MSQAGEAPAEQDGLGSVLVLPLAGSVTLRKSLNLMSKMGITIKPTLQCCCEDYK